MHWSAAAALWNFEDLPLSRYTKEGLKAAKYSRMTAIQKSALPHTLTGKDVLGAAKTGSGKTLAFIIPVGNPSCMPSITFVFPDLYALVRPRQTHVSLLDWHAFVYQHVFFMYIDGRPMHYQFSTSRIVDVQNACGFT